MDLVILELTDDSQDDPTDDGFSEISTGVHNVRLRSFFSESSYSSNSDNFDLNWFVFIESHFNSNWLGHNTAITISFLLVDWEYLHSPMATVIILSNPCALKQKYACTYSSGWPSSLFACLEHVLVFYATLALQAHTSLLAVCHLRDVCNFSIETSYGSHIINLADICFRGYLKCCALSA